MSLAQINNMQEVLEWVKECPFDYRISSYQSGAISVRVDVPEEDNNVIAFEENSNGSDD